MIPIKTDPELIAKFFERGIDTVYPSREKFARALASGKRLRFYLGADPSRPDLHIGHAVVLRRMRILQEMGHEIIFLIGDYTGLIGDPTGRDASRKQMTHAEVLQNAETYKEQIKKILNFEGDNPTLLMFNSTWLSKLSFEDIIRLSANFTVQQMIERDMYQKRLQEGKPIYLHEFFYPLMQGYDSVAMEVDGEFGGTDQMFNMMAGRTLLSELKHKEKFVITGTLLVGNDGRKMSKSFNNTIALNDDAANMYGKVMSIHDDLIGSYLTLCTDVAMDEIKRIEADLKQSDKCNPRDVKMRLARTITAIYWGETAAAAAEQSFVRQFQEHALPMDIPSRTIASGLTRWPEILVALELAPSNAEAKRLIKSGAVKLNATKVEDFTGVVELAAGDVVQVGKLKYVQIAP